MTDLRALTVRQPYGWLLASGAKTTENRLFTTDYRGPVAIHVARIPSATGYRDPAVLAELGADVTDPGSELHAAMRADSGRVVAVAVLADAHVSAGDCCLDWGFHYDGQGRVLRHLVVSGARRLTTPIRARGALGLWTPDPDLAAAILAADPGNETP